MVPPRTPGVILARGLDRAGDALGVGSTILLVLVGAVLALLALGAVTGWVRVLPILSGSMRPAIAPGDAVVVVRSPVRSVQAGQVIVYRIPVDDRRLIAHRVVQATQTGPGPLVQTRGDANNARDPWTAQLQGEHIWRVTAVVPRAGHAILLARGPYGRLLGLLAVLVVTLLLGLRRIWRDPADNPQSSLAR